MRQIRISDILVKKIEKDQREFEKMTGLKVSKQTIVNDILDQYFKFKETQKIKENS